MKITFKELISRRRWLHTELFESLPMDILAKIAEDDSFDIKIVVNGIELEPKLFDDLVENIAVHVGNEAKREAREKFEEAMVSAGELQVILNEVKETIISKYNL